MIRIIIHNYNNHTMSSFLSRNIIHRPYPPPEEPCVLSRFISKVTSHEPDWPRHIYLPDS